MTDEIKTLCYRYARELLDEARESPHAAETFRCLAEDFGEQLGQDEINILNYRYGGVSYVSQLAAGVVGKLCNENVDEDEFYNRLWNFLVGQDLFKSDEEVALFILFVLVDQRMPYRQLELLMMDEDDYARYVDELSAELVTLNQVSARDLSQKTAEGSAVLGIILKQDRAEARAVLMGNYIDSVRRRAANGG